MLWSALRHFFAGLKRTRDQKLSSGLKSGHLNLSSLFHRRGTCPVECVAAHLRGCWRSLFYCGVYLLPKVLHDSSEFRSLYSPMACFAIGAQVNAHFSQDRVQQRLHPRRERYTISATSLCTLVSPSLPCPSCRSVERLEAPVSCQQLEPDFWSQS